MLFIARTRCAVFTDIVFRGWGGQCSNSNPAKFNDNKVVGNQRTIKNIPLRVIYEFKIFSERQYGIFPCFSSQLYNFFLHKCDLAPL